ncbi:MAG TPA: hypothetical protein VK669_12325 [Candidatus Limnocylindrales bacterium]|nr:hypothetical protein [Candidatus Limnocylindrales bacterium]
MPEGRSLRSVRAAGALVAAALWTLYLVQPPAQVSASLDQSWRLAITTAAHAGMRFGHDIVFTFGPLGFVLSGSADPALAPVSVLFSLAVAGFAAVSAIGALLLLGAGPLQRALFVLAFAVLSALATLDYVALGGVVALLVSAGRAPRLAIPVGVAVGFVAGFGTLSKFTLGVDVLAAGTAVWAAFVIAGPARRRRAALRGAAAAYAVTALMLLAAWRFSPAAVFEYLRNAEQVAGGFSSAMGVSGPAADVASAVGLGIAIVAVAALAARERKPALWPLAAITLFLAWKHGFVRQDGHVVYYFETAAAVAASLALAVRGTALRYAGAAVTVTAVVLLLLTYRRSMGFLPDLVSAARLEAGAAYVFAPVAEQRATAAGMEAALAPDLLSPEIRRRVSHGTVDVLPTETALVFENRLRWDPLPVFQSYSAYTPALDALNAAALDAHGADTVLYDYVAIDERTPFGEMPMTTTRLACTYRAATPAPLSVGSRSYVVLRRTAAARCDPGETIAVPGAAIGVPIAVPPTRSPREFVTVALALRPSFGSRLRTALWRPSAVRLAVGYADGTQRVFRLVPATAGDGIIVAPTPRSTEEANAFFSESPAPAVRTITVQTPSAAYRLEGVTFRRYLRQPA